MWMKRAFKWNILGPRVVAPCRRKVNAITTERGAITTVVAAGNATGHMVPPFFVFKGQRMCEELKVGACPGSGFCMTRSGWVNGEVFMKYLDEHLAKYLPARSPEEHILLMYDGHSSHISMTLIEYAL